MLSFYCLLYLICLPGFTDQKILGISVLVNLCFIQSSFLLYWHKLKIFIRFFPVNKDCKRDMARIPPVFYTNPPATACYKGIMRDQGQSQAFPYGLFLKVVTIDHWGNFLDGHDHWADHWGKFLDGRDHWANHWGENLP